MTYNPENPLIIQSDLTVLVEVNSPRYEAARDRLVRFAELEKSPEHIHTYRINPLSLWNAAAAGVSTEEIITTLETYGKYDIPQNVGVEIREAMSRYGKVYLDKEDDALILSSEDPLIILEICRQKPSSPILKSDSTPTASAFCPSIEGTSNRLLRASDSRSKIALDISKAEHSNFDIARLPYRGIPLHCAIISTKPSIYSTRAEVPMAEAAR